MSAAAKLLDRLERVRQTGPDRWAAGCPCCESKRGRPISVRQIDDRVLVHPFCGCRTDEVIGKLGLRLGDLYEKPLKHSLPPVRGGFSARELLELIAHEVDASCILLAEIVDGRGCSELAFERVAQAASRINSARMRLR